MVFLLTYQITEVFLTDFAFLYAINGANDEVMSLPNGS